MKHFLLLAGSVIISLTLAGTFAVAEDDPETTACIKPQHIKSTKILDDYTILFEMRGGKVWQNKMKFACHGLKFEQRFSYEVHAGNLCSVDTITVIPTGGIAGPSCGLGDFTLYVPPVEPEAEQSE